MTVQSPLPLFETALDRVLVQEGGFIHHSEDPGGATNLGITRRTLSQARGRPASVEDVRRLTRAEAASIYRRLYWDAIQGDALPPGIGLAVFDMAVHSGPSRAVRLLQEALGVTADGILGPRTLAAARAADAADLVRRLSRARLGFLSRLPGWSVFGRGWRRRVLAIEREALLLRSSLMTSQNGDLS